MKMLIIDYLKAACKNNPSACAVIFQGKHYSYGELDQWSDRIARKLVDQSVIPGERIALYLDKSIQAIACIYGILKAGACYVPMSTSDPASRTAYMLKNCGARYLLLLTPANPDIDTAIIASDAVKIDVTRLLSIEHDPIAEFIVKPVKRDHIAAVLHTSGSTGDPKGVMITHGNLAAFVDWAIQAFGLNCEDRLLSHAPLQFDLSFFDLFAAVAVGVTVVLAENDDTANALRMAKLVNETGVTVWQSVPSALSLQTISGRGEAMPNVRHVLFAGEPMPRQTLLKLPELFLHARFYNVYGCTETNDTVMYSLPEQVHQAPDPLPIGQVLPFIRYRIVDPSDHDVAPGERGHLLVSGDTVMAGYLGASGQNRFLDGYYRTNDLVSEDENQLLHFHGRIDSVIKTNGYRVNLAEIEEHLLRSGWFKEVALFCTQDDLIGQRMVATVRPNDAISCSVLDLKVYCSLKLPKYAIPQSFFITQSELPKGCTGKIDRHCLAKQWLQKQSAKKSKLQGENSYELA
jgi:amino acid adenylation domain-containing protein